MRLLGFIAFALFVARPVAIYLGLIRSPLPRPERTAIGWFGSKGFASVTLTLILLREGASALPLANSVVLASSFGTIPLSAALFAVLSWATTKTLGNGDIGTSIALWFNASTFVVSFVVLGRIRSPALRSRRSKPVGTDQEQSAHGFLKAIRLPFVRSIAPATISVPMGLGSLFSIGIVFVRSVLGASDVQFALLIAMFGVGAALGMVGISRVRSPSLRTTRALIAAQGVVVAVMAFSPDVPLALGGAVAFGAVTSAALAAAMSVVQTQLQGEERELAFTAFHVMIRFGLAVAALGAGVAADLVHDVRWPLIGLTAPSRIVLSASGAMVVAVALVTGWRIPTDVRSPTVEAGGPRNRHAGRPRRLLEWALAHPSAAALGRFAAVATALGYGWWAMTLTPITWPIRLAVLVPGVALAVVGTRLYPDGQRMTSTRVRDAIRHARSGHHVDRRSEDRRFLIGLILWGLVTLAIAGFQLYNYMSWTRFEHPTVSSMINAVNSSLPVRVAAFMAWFLFGWELVKR